MKVCAVVVVVAFFLFSFFIVSLVDPRNRIPYTVATIHFRFDEQPIAHCTLNTIQIYYYFFQRYISIYFFD